MKGGDWPMSEQERAIAQTIAEAIQVLPDGKREYLIGYAEGVAAMAEASKGADSEVTQPNQSIDDTGVEG